MEAAVLLLIAVAVDITVILLFILLLTLRLVLSFLLDMLGFVLVVRVAMGWLLLDQAIYSEDLCATTLHDACSDVHVGCRCWCY